MTYGDDKNISNKRKIDWYEIDTSEKVKKLPKFTNPKVWDYKGIKTEMYSAI